ncbi:hypothetical protein ANI02nite_33980 [Acetobacter nitrogenifigens DSM 23921 = NBRC 105050]|uniref:Uncharacterized protein n=2 Tax=Acetobacter nitrogenifigens TaxID=285268 RepID=A0A511XEX3_9PROT|nr:hypothetical protein ANI02nite_33980 [Acetobacter nitrogenifigens DSM 23921 = NBRC 105050]
MPDIHTSSELPRVPLLRGLPYSVQQHAADMRRRSLWLRQSERTAFERANARDAEMYRDHAAAIEEEMEAYLLPFMTALAAAKAELPSNVIRFPGGRS